MLQPTSPPTLRPKRCKECREPFQPVRMLQPTCGYACSVAYGERIAAKARVKREKAERVAVRARKEKLKPRSYFVGKAEDAVRRFRRLEELSKGRGCMSCQRTQQEVQAADSWKPGGAWDAGHFLSKGARPELRLEPLNIWLQCKSCNGGSAYYARKGYTVGQDFETNLRAQEGDALVDWLKGPHEPAKHTVDELKAMAAEFRARSRAIEKERET